MKLPTILITSALERSCRAAIYSLKKAGFRIVWPQPTACGKYERDILDLPSDLSGCPDPEKENIAYTDWLERYMDEFPDHLILPVKEAAIFAANRARANGKSSYNFLMPSEANLHYSLSKYNSVKAAQDAGLVIPKTLFLKKPGSAAISMKSNSLFFPSILKWDNYFCSDGSYQKGNHCIVKDESMLKAILSVLEPQECGIILQSIVSGKGAGAFFLRSNGITRLQFAHKRLHEIPITGGVSSLCTSTNDQSLLQDGEKFLEAIDYNGVAMVEYRLQSHQKPVFMEVNGRLWGSLGLAIKAGADFPRAMIECHLEGKTQVVQPQLSRKVRWRNFELDIEYLRSVLQESDSNITTKTKNLLSFIRHSLDPNTKSDILWSQDPINGFISLLRVLYKEMAKLKQSVAIRKQQRLDDALLNKYRDQTQDIVIKKHSQEPQKLLFICYGNIYRSAYAEARWNAMRMQTPLLPTCQSAGFYPKEKRITPDRYKKMARARKVSLEEHFSQKLHPQMIASADWLIVMDIKNIIDMEKFYPEAVDKMMLLGFFDNEKDPIISDPYNQSIPMGYFTIRRIDKALHKLAQYLA